MFVTKAKLKKLSPKLVQIVLLLAGLYFFYQILLSGQEGYGIFPGNDSSAMSTTQNVGRFRGKPSLVLFKANWCGFCRKFWPEWKQLGSNINGVPLIALDSDAHADLMKLHHITGYPQIMFLPNGPFSTSGAQVYEGPRIASNVHSWLLSVM